MKPILWITCKLPEEIVEPLKSWADVREWPTVEVNMPHEKLEEIIQEADILWTIMDNRVSRELLQTAKNLKLICIDYHKRRKIKFKCGRVRQAWL